MPTPYRFTSAVPKQAATGQVAAVYRQMTTDFILTDGPLMSLSPAPDLLATTWALLREAQVAGQAPRVAKEVVATAVSAANHCQFCVDAHAALIHAAGEHELAEAIWRSESPADPAMARLVAWSRATATLVAPALLHPPFPPALAPEYVGTALVTHFLNRVTSSLLNEQMLPGRIQSSALFRRVAGRTLSRVVRQQPSPGASLLLLEATTSEPAPAWAGDQAVGVAYTALRQAATANSGLSDQARALVRSTLAAWEGTATSLPGDWPEAPLATLPPGDRPAARLALLAALTPGRVDDAAIAAWRGITPAATDAGLVRLIAFGAFAVTDRLTAAAPEHPGDHARLATDHAAA